jgi:sugar lactone lactonase YvrE
MAFLGDTLYVTDIDVVRAFDRKSGAAKRSILVPGALFLNDIAAGTDRLFVSDTGVKEGFKPAGTAAIYEVRADGTVKPIIRDNELGGPNGLATRGDELWSVSFGSNELYRVNPTGKPSSTKLPRGQLDGLLILPDGTFLISSWEASAIYAGRPGEAFTLAISGVPSPADIGFDPKRSRVLVPMLQKDRVEIFDWTTVRTRHGRTQRH